MKRNTEITPASTDEWLKAIRDLQTRQLWVLCHIRARLGIIVAFVLVLFLCLLATTFFVSLAQLP